MATLIKILLPINISDKYLKGYITTCDNATTIYLSSYLSSIDLNKLPNDSCKNNFIYCYFGHYNKKNKQYITRHNYIIIEDCHGKINVKEMKINNKFVKIEDVMIILYDYDKFKDSRVLTDTGDEFYKLQRLVHIDNGIEQSKDESTANSSVSPAWLSSSMFLQHSYNYLHVLKWLYSSIKRDRMVSLKQSNLILAIVTDIVLGYILLHIVAENSKQISFQVVELLENVIKMLHSLLTWLMGAPVGLKLNNAFNKMLGKYFSYHVQLWWLFLDTCSKKMDVILQIYHYMGYLGFTFQIAVISDMICITTFHSYCIYVYAARLFNIQVSGLIALLRLFVGRKYNPLRGGIDSCDHTNQELFVGTVAFTILLLLLPTTALYYFVFTMFRILSLSVQHALAKIIYIVQTLPLYVITLWLIRSHKVAGDIQVNVEHQRSNEPLVIKVHLLSKSIFELINTFQPPVVAPKHVQWTNLLSNALIGK